MVENELFDTTNLIVLSDFGLKAVSEEQQFFIEECFADVTKVKRVVNNLAFMFIYPEEGAEDTVYFELRVCGKFVKLVFLINIWFLEQWASESDYNDETEAPLVSVYRKSEIPERYHWKESKFISPIVLIARPGSILLTVSLFN